MALAYGFRWGPTGPPRLLLCQKAFDDGQKGLRASELPWRRVGWLDPSRSLDTLSYQPLVWASSGPDRAFFLRSMG
jgi:hypothetical protein